MQNNNTVSKFIQKNSMQIIVFVISFTIAWTLLGTRLQSVEAQSEENKVKLVELTKLVERITVLEERDSSTAENIEDIKKDIREIKIFLNVPVK